MKALDQVGLYLRGAFNIPHRVRHAMETPPLASLSGYELSDLPHDFIAGLIIAALSIPIAMGYAQIAGLSPIYGLYASILPAIVFALVTNTRSIVFGLDSAAVAVTGGVVVSAGVALGSPEAFALMPMLTALVALFLLIFAFTRAGMLVHYVPEPVMKGFILGISITIIMHQIPALTGIEKLALTNLDGLVAQVHEPTIVFSAFILCALFFIGRYTPNVPGALIVLVIGMAFSLAFDLESQGVAVLGSMPKGLPSFQLPHITGLGVVVMVGGAFSVAITVAMESLLALNTFSMSEGTRPHGDRELVSLALGNVASCVIGCPPCSASLSRTAAAKSARGASQLASIIGALVIAAFVLALSPYLYHLPQPVLASIVAYAMVQLIDFKTIRRYARNVRIEFYILVLVAVAVLVFGAIAGVAAGIVVSLFTNWYRRRARGQEKLMGFDANQPEIAPHIPDNVVVGYLHGLLSFTNIDRRIAAISNSIDDDTDTVIFEISDVVSIDATAAEYLRRFMRSLDDQGIHVRTVRSLALANDQYTRYELRRVMKRTRIYPTVEDAIDDVNRIKRKQLQVIPLEEADVAEEESADGIAEEGPHHDES